MSWSEREEEFSRPNIIQRWDAIEERVAEGLQDIHVLYQELPEEKREKIFKQMIKMYTPWQIEALLTESLGFQLLGVLEQMNHELDDEGFYEDVFENAIVAGLAKVSMGADYVDVDVEIEGWAPPNDLHKNRELSSLAPTLLRSMLLANEITDEEFAEAILERSSEN